VDGLSYLQAIVLGALQGVTELFPVSSLGHSVLVPAWLGGSWADLITQGTTQDSGASPYLTFVVALHVATALALLVFYRHDWARLIGGFITSVRVRRIETPTQRLAWLIVVATIPVGITGLALEHVLRTLFARPLASAVFLFLNGFILLGGERLRRRAAERSSAHRVPDEPGTDAPSPGAGPARVRYAGGRSELAARTTPVTTRFPHRELSTLAYREALVVGAVQTFALLAGISRSGVTMVAGLARGLDHEEAARFSFLLATPVILAAGVLKLPSLAGPAGRGIHGQVLVGAIVAGVAAYASLRFLTRWFTTRTLTPFAVYCLAAGALSIVRFA